MTFAELEALLQAAAKREERQCRFQAQMIANLMNCWTKKPVTVEMLLGLPEAKRQKSFTQMSSREQSSSLDEAWKRELKRRERSRRRLHNTK